MADDKEDDETVSFKGSLNSLSGTATHLIHTQQRILKLFVLGDFSRLMHLA